MKWGLSYLAAAIPLACAVLAPLVAAATASATAQQPFEHYQLILDRMPFGAPPPPVDPSAAAAPTVTDAQMQAEQQKLAKQINMSCINVTPGGKTAIGFTDLGEKPPLNYYLLVGDEGGGWTVLDANYDDEWAQIEKDGVTITLKLGKGLIDAPPEPEKPTAVAAAAQGAPAGVSSETQPPAITARAELPPGLIRRPSSHQTAPTHLPAAQIAELQKTREEIANLRKTGGDLKSYMERLHERKEQERTEKKAAEESARSQLQELARKITQDELAKKEREMNLSLIEQGAQPISNIELTPEEEQSLVDKGVLTP